ncbi:MULTISPECIES: alcohol dehydrogenase catalytic domain-containing protein [unclassified Streptomyces]|uniref:alcohol dehydrogenase catalytic domain-containing protein n=1 Tax=unclassified Streptomyces TaxID=2593676 RepID=UPI00278C89F4|nr:MULTISPECIES: alcohol dehydrogenase catalytic domain-containing protein [unclassified Streptomyces]
MATTTHRAAVRAAVLHGPKDLRTQDRPLPEPGEGEVLVAVRAVGLCGSDLHYYEHGENGPNVLRQPTVLGHEPSGIVVGHGAGTDELPHGTPVAVEPAHPCGRCALCRAGRYNLCPKGTCFGSPPTDGALTELIAVPRDFVHPLPEGMDVKLGALIEPLAVAVHAVRRAGVEPGERVLVSGAGPIGVLVAQVAAASGAAVTVSDVAAERREFVAGLGVEAVDAAVLQPDPARAHALADPDGYDSVLDCSGVGAALVSGIRALRPGGTAVVVGNPNRPVTELPLAWMQRQEMALLTSFRYGAGDFAAAVRLAGGGRVRLDGLVTAEFPLERADEALRVALTDRTQMKVLVTSGGVGV